MRGYGARLRKLRGKKTIQQTAQEMGISCSSLNSYELEQRVPRDEVKIMIANYYKKSVSYIFYPKMSQ